MRIPRIVERNTDIVFKRAPAFAIGATLIIAALGGVGWLLKDSYLAVNENSAKIKAMEAEVHHCQEMRQAMQAEIVWLRMENSGLKQRLTTLEETVRTKMP